MKTERFDDIFLKHKSRITGDCFVFKFLRRSVDRPKYLQSV